MKQAVIYTRLSGSNSEASIDQQHKDCKQYIEQRDDLELADWYNEGKRQSGWDASREKYQEVLTEAENGNIDAVVVRDGSRIGRDQTERLDVFFDFANKWDVEFHTKKRGFVDPSNPMDILLEVFSAQKDDYGKREEIEKAKSEIARRLEKGYYHGCPPYGFKYTPNKKDIEPDLNEWDSLVTAVEMRVNEATYEDISEETGVGASTLSRLFNERGELFVEHYEFEDELHIEDVVSVFDDLDAGRIEVGDGETIADRL